MDETIAVHLTFAELDERFRELEARHWHELRYRPRRARQDHDVLLVSTGPEGTGGLYMFVGILKGAVWDGPRVTFSAVARFVMPVVGVYERDGFRCRDLMGTKKKWGPSWHTDLPLEAASLAEELAARPPSTRSIGELQVIMPPL